MSASLGQLPGIADIALPAAPAESSPLAFILPVLLLVCLLLVLLWRYRLSRRGQALQQLRQLQANTQTNREQFVWQLAAIVRRGLKLKRLTADTRLPDKLRQQSRRWQGFIQRLDQARYAGIPLDESGYRLLLEEARYWLRKWP